MTLDEAIKVMETEKTCVNRQGTPQCDRDCVRCNLVLPAEDVLTAYNMVISALKELVQKEEILKARVKWR